MVERPVTRRDWEPGGYPDPYDDYPPPIEPTAPLPCGWCPDPAHVALKRLAQAEARYVADMQAAGGDADLTAAAEATFVAALDAVEAYTDAATAAATDTREGT